MNKRKKQKASPKREKKSETEGEREQLYLRSSTNSYIVRASYEFITRSDGTHHKAQPTQPPVADGANRSHTNAAFPKRGVLCVFV